MSGHSKWSTIKRQKGATDIKRGQIFTKLANSITMSVRQGGGVMDPTSNPRLRLAIETARSANMPKDNIERAIARAAGKQAESMEEIIYEGFGPGGFSIMVEAITDNKQRTTPVVKSTFDKFGGAFGNPGSVAYQFSQKGQITLKKQMLTIDEVFLIAVDAGAVDVEEVGDEVFIYTEPQDLAKVRDVLQAVKVTIINAELIRKPLITTQISDKIAAEKALTFLDKIENLEKQK